ncbi:MAG: aminotransferase class III-fold pyridoxal phosphate-dependent enzyme [Rhizobiales bacterium]|nr:aminotransferase class III-fold pyridoxal phosphate-dependent enzyme [Hyphomicrobiales bacterium]
MTDYPIGGPQDLFSSRSNRVPLPLIVKAEGVRMWDDGGREYIDVSSGPVVSNIGHGNARVAEAMARQARTMDFAYTRVARHQPNIDLAERIAKLAGPGYERVCLASGGSESMEIAIKFLRQYVVATGRPQKRKIISLSPSYHGGTVALLGVSGDEAMDPFLDGFGIKAEHVPAPFQYRVPANHTQETYRMACANALEEKIKELGADNVLCFVAEPVGGLATGAQPLMEDYVNKVREICSRHDIYLVYDEILCGTGRTGHFLASHAWPKGHADIVVLAKGLGSGYAPLSATLAPAKMVDELAGLTGFNLSHTYCANPIACATGLAVLDEYERGDLVSAAGERGRTLKRRLEALAERHPSVGDVRGAGLLLAVELVTDKESKGRFPVEFSPTEEVRISGLEHGLIIYTRRTANGRNGDWFIVAPPLTITEEECDEMVRRLDLTLTDFETRAAPYMARRAA